MGIDFSEVVEMLEAEAYQLAIEYLGDEVEVVLRSSRRSSYRSCVWNILEDGYLWGFGFEVVRGSDVDWVDSSNIFGVIVDEATSMVRGHSDWIEHIFKQPRSPENLVTGMSFFLQKAMCQPCCTANALIGPPLPLSIGGAESAQGERG